MLEQCAAVGTQSIDCLDWLARLELSEGRCESGAVVAKQEIASDPNFSLGYAYLARAEFGRSHSTKVARVLEAERLAHMPAEAREVVRLRDEFFFNVYDGRFEDALAVADAWERAVGGIADASQRTYPFVCRIDLELEMGDRAKGALEARRFQEASESWLRNAFVDPPTEVTRALYLTGAISLEALHERRRRDGAIIRARGGYFEPAGVQWFETYAQVSLDGTDAREAIDRLPHERPTIEAIYRDVGVDEEIGRNYLLAGQSAESLAWLKRATRSCNYMKSIHLVRAHRLLGDALAESDPMAACKEYREVIERWGHAPRSITARAARAAMQRLRCSNSQPF